MQTTPYHRGEHVAGVGLYDASHACPACGASGRRTSVFRIQRGPDVHLLECTACGACSASHMPTADTLDAYYARYYDASDASVTFEGVERFARHLARCGRRLSRVRETLRVLDFGGGDGTIAVQAAERLRSDLGLPRAEVVLCDYQAPAASPFAAVEVRGVEPLREVEGTFHFVIASAILEHVPALSDTMQALWQHLAPGGVFYARTPYWRPLLRVFPRIDLTFPGHVHDLGPRYWSGVAETYGWRATTLASRPSIVETSVRQQPLRSLAAYALKAPAHAEAALRGPRRDLRWGAVGGWEAVLRRDPSPPEDA